MRTRHVLAATAALALVGSTAGAALTGASAAPAHHKAKPDRRHGRQEAGRPAQRRAGAGRHPLLDRHLRRHRSTSRRPAAPCPVVYKSKHHGCRRRLGRRRRAPLRDRFRRQQVRRGLDPRHRRGAGAARRHLRLREGGQPRRQVQVRLPQDAEVLPGPAAQADPGVLLRRQGDPPLRGGHRQRHHLRRRRRRQRDPRVSTPRDSSRPSPRSSRSRSRSPGARRRPTACRTARSARSTPSRRCRPTSSTAPTASSTSPACRADRRTAASALNGRVLKIDPATGKVSTVVGGLLSPTGVAVASNGDIYVAQLFRGVISKIKAGKSQGQDLPRACRSPPRSRRPRPGCSRRSTPCRWQEAQGTGRHDHALTDR